MRADYNPETGVATIAWRPADEVLPAPSRLAGTARQWVPCSRCHDAVTLSRFAVADKTVDLATLVCDRCLEQAKLQGRRLRISGKVNPDGTVSITWDPTVSRVMAPERDGLRHWLPCSRCGRVISVTIETLAYVCEVCEERAKL